ncbi:bifunctional DNA primase/polymerase domain protein [Dickeya phage Sucellus]|nr:bifunctional DNA primase/polymerase domain protein [Dickeya phage Sucellus]
MDKKIDYALRYAASGLKIFPVHYVRSSGECSCGKPECRTPGKHTIASLAPNSHLNATSNEQTIKAWWTAWPLANIGLACSASGLFVVDIDVHSEDKNGFDALDDFETTTDSKVNSPVAQDTGGGGLHMFFKAPEGLITAPSNLGKNYKGVDFKFNGLVLLEPSNHRSGNKYKFQARSINDLLSGNIPPLPASICDFIKKSQTPEYSPQRYTAPRRLSDEDDIIQMQEALDCIPAMSLSDDELLKVGMGLQQALPGGIGKGMFFDWLAAALGSKFSSKLTERRWRSFKFRSGGRTIASFFEVAASFGFDNKGKAGEYTIPEEFVYMTPEKVSDEYAGIKPETIYIANNPPEVMPEIFCETPIMMVDYDEEPTETKVEISQEVSFPQPLQQKTRMYSSDSRISILQDALDSLNDDDFDENAGMPTSEEWEEWRSKFNGNRVLFSLFEYHVMNNTAFVPELAMAFSISTIGALLAGRFEHSDLTTNLYMMVVADTSVGKSITMGLVSKVFDFCNETNRIGPKDIVSDKGFFNDLLIDPARFFQLDEIGELFSVIFSPKANSSQILIKRAILDGFSGYGNKINKTASRADSKNNPIVDAGRICPSILGVTTPVKIFKAMSSNDIIDGMLNRLFVLFNDNPAPDGKLSKRTDLPVEFCQWYMTVRNRWSPQGSMPIAGADAVTSMTLTPESSRRLKAIKKIETSKRRGDEKYGSIWGRLTEIVIRVSMIFEITSRPYSGQINTDSIDSAFALVTWSIEKTEFAARNKIADSEEESIAKEVLECISNNPRGIFYHELIERTRLSSNTRMRSVIISSLKDEQKIKEFRFSKKGDRGRPRKLLITMQNLLKLSKADREALGECSLEI